MGISSIEKGDLEARHEISKKITKKVKEKKERQTAAGAGCHYIKVIKESRRQETGGKRGE